MSSSSDTSKVTSNTSQTPAYVDIAIVFILFIVMSLTVLYVKRLAKRWKLKEDDFFKSFENTFINF